MPPKRAPDAVTVRALIRPTQAQADTVLDAARRWGRTFRWAWKRIVRHNDGPIRAYLDAVHAGAPKVRMPRLRLPPGIWRQATAFSGLPSVLAEGAVQDALDRLRAFLEAHGRLRRRRHGPARCHPARVVFGGRRLARRLARTRKGTPEHEALRDEWRLRRQGRVTVGRGRARHGGNAFLQFDFVRGTARIRVTPRGPALECPFVTHHARWDEFRRHAGAGRPYSATLRIRRWRPLRVEVLLSWVPEKEMPEPHEGNGSVLGLDLNATDRAFVAWAVAGPDGSLQARGRIRIRTAGRRARRTQCFEIAHRVCSVAARYRVSAVAVEALRKPQAPRGSGRVVGPDGRVHPVPGAVASRRKVYGWPVRMFQDALTVVAARRRQRILWVDPAYTSVVGRLKYATLYNLSVHQGAALATARRAQGRRERMPRALRVLLASVPVSSPDGAPADRRRGPVRRGSAAVKLEKQEGRDRGGRKAVPYNPWRGVDVPGLTARLAAAAGAAEPPGRISPARLKVVFHDPGVQARCAPAGGAGRDRAASADGASGAAGPILSRGP